MREGSLVLPASSIEQDGDEKKPCVVVRGPYELAVISEYSGKKITHLKRCVDVLTPSGDIIKGVACELLERV